MLSYKESSDNIVPSSNRSYCRKCHKAPADAPLHLPLYLLLRPLFSELPLPLLPLSLLILQPSDLSRPPLLSFHILQPSFHIARPVVGVSISLWYRSARTTEEGLDLG